MTTATPTNRPTAPLPSAAVAAIHRLEARLAGLRRGESTVINGTVCTAVSLEEAEALVRSQMASAATVEKVRAALGFRPGWKPSPHLGETATHLTAWSQMELNDLFERVGGTVTTRQVERSTHGGESTWTATEITLTVEVPGVGPVEVVTDIEDDPEHGFRTDVPVVALARYQSASEQCRELAASGDYAACLIVQDEMAMCRCQLAKAGRLHLIGGA